MRVLVIPEDFRKDLYVLKPLVEAMMAAVGKPRATVRVCQQPLMGGVSEALKWEKIQEVLDRYRGMVDLYLLLVDRDSEPHRRERIDKIEAKAAETLPSSRLLLGENAWQEVEVWILAGHDLPSEWSWTEIRANTHPKETYFEPFPPARPVRSPRRRPGEALKGRRRSLRARAPALPRRCRRARTAHPSVHRAVAKPQLERTRRHGRESPDPAGFFMDRIAPHQSGSHTPHSGSRQNGAAHCLRSDKAASFRCVAGWHS